MKTVTLSVGLVSGGFMISQVALLLGGNGGVDGGGREGGGGAGERRV